jgi:hypothetical protein
MTLSWTIILPPHQSEHPSNWYYRVQEIKKYEFGLASNGIIFMPNLIKIRSAVPVLYVRMDR